MQSDHNMNGPLWLIGLMAKTEIIYPKNVRAKVAMYFTYNE